ncbi:lysophospholipid acyltransferase family protein [Rhodovibrionaceae bacterium A322]
MSYKLGSGLTAVRRLSAFALFTLVCMPVQACLVLFRSSWQSQFPRWYHRQLIWLLGFQVEVKGLQTAKHPTLFVANHVSYWDIVVLGSLVRGCFVAKSEVASWPFFSTLAKLQRTVFVERRSSRAAEQRDQIVQRLEAGDDLILFAEGTSSDGNRVLPFKSALFSVAERRVGDAPLQVQPVTVSYTKLDGLPMGRFLRPYFAWYGDMDLAPHIWESLGLGNVTVQVTFHAPVDIEAFGSRKALSDFCQQRVRDGMVESLTGRELRPALVTEGELSAQM